jgi:hypothetical protein
VLDAPPVVLVPPVLDAPPVLERPPVVVLPFMVEPPVLEAPPIASVPPLLVEGEPVSPPCVVPPEASGVVTVEVPPVETAIELSSRVEGREPPSAFVGVEVVALLPPVWLAFVDVESSEHATRLNDTPRAIVETND